MNQLASEKRKEHLNKVVNMIGKLTPIGENNEPIRNKDFRDVLLMMLSICTFLFDEYDVTDQIVKENSQICNMNQDLRYNDHVTCTRNDMEKLQRTVKVLDVDLDNSFQNGVVENMSALWKPCFLISLNENTCRFVGRIRYKCNIQSHY